MDISSCKHESLLYSFMYIQLLYFFIIIFFTKIYFILNRQIINSNEMLDQKKIFKKVLEEIQTKKDKRKWIYEIN